MTEFNLSCLNSKNQDIKICATCKQLFKRKPLTSNKRWEKTIYCSRSCYYKSKHYFLDNAYKRVEYFLSKTRLNQNGCMEWIGGLSGSGYAHAQIFNSYQNITKHIYEYYLKIPINRMNICHKCDNKKCINPDHLFLGTQQDNIDDMCKKDRCKKGRFTTLEIEQMCKMRIEGKTTIVIGEMFGASHSYVSRLINNSKILKFEPIVK
jgi:hypothetical protein